MNKLHSVVSGQAFSYLLGIPGIGERVFVIASGTAPTSGWTNIRLAPHFYIAPPADGIFDLDLYGDEPTGIVLEVVTPHTTSGVFSRPEWMKGIRVNADQNSIEIPVVQGTPVLSPALKTSPKLVTAGRTIVNQEIASYDDSQQPVGWCEFPLHPRMKKLHHKLTLVVEGPDENHIRKCIEQSIAAGLLAVIITAYATGGLALHAAVSAFLANLTQCLGNGFSARVDDSSHWVEWCV